MKISVDAGGYCTDISRKYGNYTYTENLMKALYRYDLNNKYYLYSFCPAPQDLELQNSWKYQYLRPRKLWMKLRVSLEELISRKDIFLALNQAVPAYTSAKIISVSHGLSYYFFPQYYRESFIRLSLQLAPMIKQSKYILVSSNKIKSEMKIVYPNYKNIVVLPFGIPFDMQEYSNPIRRKQPYFLYVGMNHPIKNLKFIIKAFKQFRKIKGNFKYELILIGPQFMYSQKKDNIRVIPSINRQELKEYYRNATACLTSSLYESFNFPVIEALSQSCIVIGTSSSIIPELRPFVNLADSIDAYVEEMNKACKKFESLITPGQLSNLFSWKKYINGLVKLYSS